MQIKCKCGWMANIGDSPKNEGKIIICPVCKAENIIGKSEKPKVVEDKKKKEKKKFNFD